MPVALTLFELLQLCANHVGSKGEILAVPHDFSLAFLAQGEAQKLRNGRFHRAVLSSVGIGVDAREERVRTIVQSIERVLDIRTSIRGNL
jgi:hypothetical protein